MGGRDNKRGRSAAIALAATIENFRESMGLTQKQLAIKAGVSQVFISQMESGKNTSHPNLATLYKISESLGLRGLGGLFAEVDRIFFSM